MFWENVDPLEISFLGFLGFVAIFAYCVATRYVLKTFETNYYFSTSIFIVILTCSVGILLMLVIEMMDIGTDASRALHWRILISGLNGTILFLTPSILIFKLVYGLKLSKTIRLFL
jgi:hypothetical protein